LSPPVLSTQLRHPLGDITISSNNNPGSSATLQPKKKRRAAASEDKDETQVKWKRATDRKRPAELEIRLKLDDDPDIYRRLKVPLFS
jgi:hypothetical protein